MQSAYRIILAHKGVRVICADNMLPENSQVSLKNIKAAMTKWRRYVLWTLWQTSSRGQ
jgi:hypothetical protein